MDSKMFENTMDLKEIQDSLKNQLIKNKQLEDYIKFVKGKSILEESDFKDIEEVILDSKTFTGEINLVYFDEIKLFPNLKSLKLYNLGISEDELKIIQENTKVEHLYLYNCEISDLKSLTKLKSLYIANCKLENPDELSSIPDLEELTIDYTKFENYNFLNSMKSLEKLYFINMDEKDLDLLPGLENIEFLSLDGINYFTYEKIRKFSNLKVLSIAKKMDDNIKSEIEKIKNNGIEILVEDVYDEL